MHFTVEAQLIAKRFLVPGAIAIDATAGNGFDTLFLADQVGGLGLVYAVDVQSRAIEIVQQKLQQTNLAAQCRLSVASHADLANIVAPGDVGNVSVAMFNLGYLPFGDKSIVTSSESTIAALDQVSRMMKAGGLISVLAYLGHPGGAQEATSVAEWVERLADIWTVERFQDSDNPNSPILWTLVRNVI